MRVLKFLPLAFLTLSITFPTFSVQLKFGDYSINDPDFVLGLFCHNPSKPCIEDGSFRAVIIGGGNELAETNAGAGAGGATERVTYNKTVSNLNSVDYEKKFDASSFFRVGILQLWQKTDNHRVDRDDEIYTENAAFQSFHTACGFSVFGETKIGFHYRIAKIEHAILGSFRFSDDTHNQLKGVISSYGFGVNQKFTNINVDAYYSSPFTGKAKIEGEDRLFTLRGYTGLEIGFEVNPTIEIRIFGGFWQYREDDIFTRGIDPNGGNNIFLTGLDLQNHIIDENNYGIIFGKKISNSLKLKAVLSRINSKGVFTQRFSLSDLKGSNSSDVKYNRAGVKLDARFNSMLKLNIAYRILKTDKPYDLVDSTNTYGFRFYEDYKSSASSMSIGLDISL